MENWNAMSDDAFRGVVRRFIKQNYPDELRFLAHRPRWMTIKPWVMKLVDNGWSAPNWPVSYGGMGLSPSKLLIFMDEQESWGVARAPDHGIVQLGPMLIRYGTEAQQEALLPQMRNFETIWCQGYSEPNAGSDLANLATEATLDDHNFIINGRKLWTSFALDATHMYLLARTKKTAKKQEGITFFLVNLSAPGVTIRGIKNIAGGTEFCEVLLENVHTPLCNMVGEMHGGWKLAKSVLGFERINSGSPRRAQFAFKRLETLAHERGLLNDLGFMERYTQLRLALEDLKAVYAYFAEQMRSGEALGPDLSILKILATETTQRITEFMLEASGDHGLIVHGDADNDRVDVLTPFLVARSFTIGAGTTEIQRNIIARKILNLPTS